MITTITLNAAIDQIYQIESLSVGGVNRVGSIVKDAGGKGMNVAKVVQSSGASVDVGGFAGGNTGDTIRQLLNSRSIPNELIQITEESRVCLTVLNREDGIGTELLESGPVISTDEWSSLLDWLTLKSKKVKWFVLSGSLPKGVPANAYAQMIEIINANGAKTVLDSSGPALELGIKAVPFAIKPNEEEIMNILGENELSELDLLEVGKRFVESGIEHVCFTLGKSGAMIINRSGSYKVNAPEIQPLNAVGSGDAFVGGLVYGCAMGEDVFTTYKRAVASGTCNAMHKDIGYVKKDIVESLMSKITVEKI
ncbi:1-phosphofructokinase family hexose kinase [Sporosarcina aquimarina]|uniref:1-phosphofructokinase family hexose kinase n=1 Tax=Sporosarcina aquimarina TaxID=114975 RepID=UPI00203D66AE|nr:1-phosphofructokinase family hexose kinase [Sporosarcina aquimarina]MCM3758408.1 1-phosphofructokinase family hexose kinase [Sporosarcina aquimarina]